MVSITNKDSKPRWYALRTYTGYEAIAKQNLEITTGKFNLEDRILEIIIPMEEILVEKRGKKVLVQKKTMPGYILVKMVYGDDIWHAVTNTQYVTSFVGPEGRPEFITDEEIARMRLETVKVDATLAVADTIEIIDGPLASLVGKVMSVDIENSKCKASVEVFGRDTTVELNLDQLRKIN